MNMLHLLLLLLSICRQSVSVLATVTAVSEPSVSAVASVTAIYGATFGWSLLNIDMHSKPPRSQQ